MSTLIEEADDALPRLKDCMNELSKNSRDLGKRPDRVRLRAPYYDPPKILGIALNYRDHARDFNLTIPPEPISFLKPRTTIIGDGDAIILPPEAQRVTAEAELGVIIGKRCRNLKEEDAHGVVFGYVPLLDMTADDIFKRNQLNATRAKSFDTFFSFGPYIVTPDEIEDLHNLTVSTVLNGQVGRSSTVGNMAFPTSQLISFHSHVFTFEPGDIIATGTPGATPIEDGDVVEARLGGFAPLKNSVMRVK